MIFAKVIEDSISDTGSRITTMQVKFQRFILPEFNTHRVFSRNFSSSRAIPTQKLIEQVRTNPATPIHWGKNQPGMQASQEMDEDSIIRAKEAWATAANQAAYIAERLASIGTHKQVVNRIIEPFMWVSGIVTSTEWDNWHELRTHEDAQPEIHELALCTKRALAESTPKHLKPGQWHLPYLTSGEVDKFDIEMAKKISAARCCRVSYLKHDGNAPVVDEDLALFDRLASARPIHASPLEHQATPDIVIPGSRSQMARWSKPTYHGNFVGWIQHRKQWENEILYVNTEKK